MWIDSSCKYSSDMSIETVEVVDIIGSQEFEVSVSGRVYYGRVYMGSQQECNSMRHDLLKIVEPGMDLQVISNWFRGNIK